MESNSIVIKDIDLSSRASGSILRRKIQSELQRIDLVTVDFSNVKSISSSYADELFGVLSVQIGVEQLTRRVQLKNVSEQALRSIAEAIQMRLEQAQTRAA